MMAGRGVGLTAAGGPARHIPVMLSEVIEALEPRDGKHFIDGTFGAGGYSRGLLEAARCTVLAIDRDPAAARVESAARAGARARAARTACDGSAVARVVSQALAVGGLV